MAKSFSADVSKLLEGYIGDINDIVEQSANEAAEICTRQLRNTSPRRAGRGQHYANGWTMKPIRSGNLVSFTVYNRTKPQLTHLLENGHVVRNKKGTYGRAPAIKHIEPAEEAAIQKFELRVRARIRSLK